MNASFKKYEHTKSFDEKVGRAKTEESSKRFLARLLKHHGSKPLKRLSIKKLERTLGVGQ